MKYYILLLFFHLLFHIETHTQPFVKVEPGSGVLMNLEKGKAEWCDYDMDGDPDVVITGNSVSGPVTRLYRNDDLEFTVINVDFMDLKQSTVSWNDYDLDGDPDLFLAGKDMNSNVTGILYQNSGGDQFEEITTNLQGFYEGTAAWADLDNDGDQDLITIGNSGESGTTRIFRNDGDGQFFNFPHNMPNIYRGDLDIGDYDQDLDMDILMIGVFKDIQGNEQKMLRIFRNNGGFQFSEMSSGFVGMSESNCRWGDYDGDGDLDIVANGSTEAPTHLVYLYQNMGNDSFLNIGIEIFGAVNGSVEWGDYDNDGDLDFLLTGMPSYGDEPITEIYRNIAENLFNKADNLTLPKVFNSDGKWCDYDSDGDLDVIIMGQLPSGDLTTALYRNENNLINSPPTVPVGMITGVSGNEVFLSWDPSSDVETTSAGLTYNLRIGSTISFAETMSPMSKANGSRLIVKPGNTNQNNQWKVIDLAPGEYAWSVQALDNVFEGSSFSEEQNFSVDPVKVNDQLYPEYDMKVFVYPNPFRNDLFIQIGGMDQGPVRIKLYSPEGRLVAEEFESETTTNGFIDLQYKIHLVDQNLKNGVYLLEVFSMKHQKNITLMKVLKRD